MLFNPLMPVLIFLSLQFFRSRHFNYAGKKKPSVEAFEEEWQGLCLTSGSQQLDCVPQIDGKWMNMDISSQLPNLHRQFDASQENVQSLNRRVAFHGLWMRSDGHGLLDGSMCDISVQLLFLWSMTSTQL